jgi:O-antigen ligase
MGLGALMASPLPLTGRVAFAGALIAPVCTFALWLRRPELLIGGYIFALPLLDRRELVAGFEPAELATAVVVAVGALSVVTRRRARIPARFQLMFWTLVGLAIVGAIAGLANEVLDREQVATSVFKPLSWVVVLYLVLLYFDSPRKLRALLLAMILSGAAVAMIAVVQLATGNVPVSGDDVPRARGTFENYNDLGGFMALMAVPALTYALSTRRGSLKVLLLAAFVVQLAALLLSGTIGSLLGLLVAGLLSLRIWKVRPAAGFAMVAFALVAAAALALLAPAQASRVHLLGNRAEDRLGTYAAGIKIAKDHVWLGTGSVEKAMDLLMQNSEYHSTRFGLVGSEPHNIFLEQLVVSGVVGLALLVFLVWFAVRTLLASMPRPAGDDYILRWGLVLGATAFLVQNFTNNLLNHARLGVLFLVFVAIAARFRDLDAELVSQEAEHILR